MYGRGMPSPSPAPTIYVVMQDQGGGGFWSNTAAVSLLAALLSVALGAFLTARSQRRHARALDQQQVARENREVRRGLYVRVALTFDKLNHLILEWIRLDAPADANERQRVGNDLRDTLNHLSALATEVEVSGSHALARLLHRVASRPNFPKGSDGHNRYIQDLSAEEWEEFRTRLLGQRGEATDLMNFDLAVLSQERPSFWRRLFWSLQEDRAIRTRAAEPGPGSGPASTL